MIRVDYRFFAEAVGAGLLVLAVLGSAIALLEAIEVARWAGFAVWAAEVTGRVPARLAAISPVAGALGAAITGLRWQRKGHLAALAGMGWSPVRPALAGAVAALVVNAGAAGLRDLAGTRPDVDGAWVALPDATFVRARSLVGNMATEVDYAHVSEGTVVWRGQAAISEYPEAWTVRAVRWTSDGVDRVPAVLPTHRQWRTYATQVGADTPLFALWRAPHSPARVVWLVERPATLVGAALLGWIAVALAWIRPRRAYAAVLGLAVTWRLGQAGALAVAARGGWAPVWSTVVPVLVLELIALVLWVRLERPTRP